MCHDATNCISGRVLAYHMYQDRRKFAIKKISRQAIKSSWKQGIVSQLKTSIVMFTQNGIILESQ
jgi:hypothetical protein